MKLGGHMCYALTIKSVWELFLKHVYSRQPPARKEDDSSIPGKTTSWIYYSQTFKTTKLIAPDIFVDSDMTIEYNVN